MKISLDSNVFADQDFIDWLQMNTNLFSVNISFIAALETLYWYKLRGLEKTQFDYDVSKLDAIVHDLKIDQLDQIAENAIDSNIKFRHHARDIMIGSHAQYTKCTLITENTKDFKWMRDNILSPDELVLQMKENIE